jgi:hypothetical protein
MGINQHNTWFPPFQLAIDIYSHVFKSELKFYEPQELWSSYSAACGLDASIHGQQDVDEFFNILMNKLEEALEPTSENDLVRRIFVGLFT